MSEIKPVCPNCGKRHWADYWCRPVTPGGSWYYHKAKTRADLELLRSDVGDGGWSLHLKGSENEDGIPDILMSGEAELGPDGEWSRPNKEDYARALHAVNARRIRRAS